MVSALAACLFVMADAVPPELDAYLKRPDPSFAWSEKKEGHGSLHLRMTSQTWRNVRWTHDIVVVEPAADARPSTLDNACILYITGGEPNKADLNEAGRLSNLAKMPVALLFQIPNQPLFGMKEDDLIAHTFEQYLKEAMAPPSTHPSNPQSAIRSPQSTDWPLLFPMVKSAARAMDALQAATKNNKSPLKRFVVTGASKRGWTAWLTGAIQDKRVIGIAPMVFDNLNFKAQLKHQLESWGKYSEMIGDYIDRGLDQIVETPQGTHLVAMVDPYTYRERITIPKLIVNGANDRYWTVDALSLYWQELAEPKYCSIVPNAGHSLGDMNQALHAIAAFARSCAGEFEFPHVRGGVGEEKSQWGPLIDTEKPEAVRAVRFWSVRADTWDFRDSQWQPVAGQQLESNNHSTKYIYVKKTGVPGAVFAEAEYEINGIRFVLSTPVSLLKENRDRD